MSTPIDLIQTPNAPQAIGPYSQATRLGNMIFTSGQIPMKAEGGDLLDADVATQTRQIFTNLKAVLDAAGSSLDRVVKATVFMKDLGRFKEMNAVYAEAFGDHRPARSTVEVSNLPAGAAVEIDLIATREG